MAEPTFEENLTRLEQIVASLEQGQVPLEAAMDQFKTGVKLSQQLEKTLKEAEQTVTKMVKDDGTLVDFEPADHA
ncbi:exodeoxyribonuclease VII small subunit [Lacticaseibacillus parakribbianus]|uniref:exodeoxyribonuclease VII small subunit n=1 Tax=Lacticaseibacillus parakribbianus TaxID=2970927 RepID=UPI0021CB64AE|nr:exodeoxyribonuclease VII small subunit [Lacticaseibacillus parakribbianus]